MRTTSAFIGPSKRKPLRNKPGSESGTIYYPESSGHVKQTGWIHLNSRWRSFIMIYHEKVKIDVISDLWSLISCFNKVTSFASECLCAQFSLWNCLWSWLTTRWSLLVCYGFLCCIISHGSASLSLFSPPQCGGQPRLRAEQREGPPVAGQGRSDPPRHSEDDVLRLSARSASLHPPPPAGRPVSGAWRLREDVREELPPHYAASFPFKGTVLFVGAALQSTLYTAFQLRALFENSLFLNSLSHSAVL